MKSLSPLFFLFLLCLLGIACQPPASEPAATEHQEYSIEQFYQNTRIGGGAISADDQTMLVSSDESGIFNVYEINLSNGSKTTITNSTEDSYFAVDYVPGTDQILYSADKGGDELNHLYLRSQDGSVQDLTPGEQEKAGFAGWSEDKKSLYVSSNKRDPQYFDLYKMDVGEWEAEMLYQNNDGRNVGSMTNDEKFITLNKTITTSSNQLWIYDRETEESTEISDPEMPGQYSSAGFSDDGRFLYYTTNKGREFTYLASYEIATGEHQTVYEADWDVMYSYLSENEKYRVVAINEDGKNTLKIFDAKSNAEVPFPNLEDGDVTSVSISDSEKVMRLSVGSSKAPSNMYLYNFETQELKKLTETLNSEINPEHLVSAEVVRFASFDSLEIPAIYYRPRTASKDNKVPALVWVHGGPGGQSRTGYFALLQYLVNHGYAVLAVNNRGSSGYGKTFNKMDDKNHGDKDLKDCIWGKKWLQGQDYVDADRIGIIGGSYGGYMTMAALTFAPEEFEVGVNIFGVTNWLRTLKSIPPYWESFRTALYEELGDPTTADSVRLYNISPVFHAAQVQKPLMVLQGANDPRVLQIESDEIVEAVKANQVPVEYLVFEDEGHGFIKKENEIEGYGKILTFLDTYLAPELKN